MSPLEVAIGALDGPAGEEQGEEYCRQLAWRDFFYQVTAAFPYIARKSYRPGAAWHEDRRALDAWREGQTGIPIVDAWPGQLAAEGFMHNRARMDTASFLTRNLGIDLRMAWRTSTPCSPTPTWRTARATGSGWPGPATTPGPTG